MIVSEKLNFRMPEKIEIKKSSVRLNRNDGSPLQHSLFDPVPDEDFNDVERDVALYLEDQREMFFWYRNRARNDYSIQGWRKQRIYPDFIFTTKERDNPSFNKAFVVETKGLHLKNEDTVYKQTVFDLCNQLSIEKNMGELGYKFKDKPVRFEVIFEDEWKRKLNEITS